MDERSGGERSAHARAWGAEWAEAQGALWTVAAVLPEQFHAPAPGRAQRGPEAALLRAVLEEAVNCVWEGLQATSRRKQRLAREAEEWFGSEEAKWPFSFVNICTVLGLEPQYIRRGLHRWQHQHPTWRQKSKRRVVRSRSPVRLAA